MDLFVVNSEGVVLFGGDLVGADLFSEEYLDSELGRVYDKVKNDFGVGVFDPGYYDGELSIFVTSPVLVDSVSFEGKQDLVGDGW